MLTCPCALTFEIVYDVKFNKGQKNSIAVCIRVFYYFSRLIERAEKKTGNKNI